MFVIRYFIYCILMCGYLCVKFFCIIFFVLSYIHGLHKDKLLLRNLILTLTISFLHRKQKDTMNENKRKKTDSEHRAFNAG